MNIVYLGIGIVVVLVLLILIMSVRRSGGSGEEDVPEWEHLGVEHCGSVCPNMGACDDCDIGFP